MAEIIPLRDGSSRFVGWLSLGLGGVIVVFAVIISPVAGLLGAILPALLGVGVAVVGVLVIGYSTNSATLLVHEDRIECAKGLAPRWFARAPVALSSVVGAIVWPRWHSIILFRTAGERPPMVHIQPTQERFQEALDILRERLVRIPWVTSDVPLAKMIGPTT